MPADYHLPSFHFRVDFLFPNESQSDQECRFSKVSGIESSVVTKEYPELGNLYNVVKLPMSRSYPNLVLERGIIVSSRIYDWFQQSFYDLQIEPIPVMVSLLGEDHKPVMSWLFYDAYPVNWKYSNLDASKSELLIESITLGYSRYVELMNTRNQDASAFLQTIKGSINS
jgi:phage tail-like protein